MADGEQLSRLKQIVLQIWKTQRAAATALGRDETHLSVILSGKHAPPFWLLEAIERELPGASAYIISGSWSGDVAKIVQQAGASNVALGDYTLVSDPFTFSRETLTNEQVGTIVMERLTKYDARPE